MATKKTGRKVTPLSKFLAERGVKHSQLANLCGLSRTRITRICNEQGAAVRPAEQAAICEALSVELERLWPFAALGHLDTEKRAIERLCQWLRSEEGRLVFRRVGAAIGDAT